MGFFEEQDRARRATVELVLLYVLAVAAIVAAANAMLVPVYYYSSGAHPKWSAFAVVTAATLAVIALGSLEIVARLSIGEAELATLLAGRRVLRGSPDEAERRLLNIVDEMAIASGLAAPPVYVLGREKGINAFAAGRSPNQAIVVVTAGALENLSRDELQAVIAHEFSHIINGDIVLNLRGACVLQGIVFLYAIGRFVMSQFKDEERGLLFWAYLPVGVAFFIIGWIGLPFTRWIQGAISREREYLADASAVRFTRNADALCGALARIRTHGEGSRILNWHAEAMAHMLFAAASHPPIEERMRRANPHVPPSFYFERRRVVVPEKPKAVAPQKITSVAALVASMGEPTPESLAHAAGLLGYLPLPVREALGDPAGAQAVLLGCLIDGEPTARAPALKAIGDEDLARKSEVLAPLIAGLDRGYRLPLVALALPTLRKDLDAGARAKFLDRVRAVIQSDRRVTLSEFVFITILEAHLEPRPASGNVACSEAEAECALVLSLLAQAGSDALAGFEKGRQALDLAFAASDRFEVDEISRALAKLRNLAPAEKGRLVAACAEVTMADGEVRLAEHELLRAVCSSLDCPMPQALATLDARLLRR